MSFWVIPQFNISKTYNFVRSEAPASSCLISSLVNTITRGKGRLILSSCDRPSRTRGSDGIASICQSHRTNPFTLAMSWFAVVRFHSCFDTLCSSSA